MTSIGIIPVDNEVCREVMDEKVMVMAMEIVAEMVMGSYLNADSPLHEAIVVECISPVTDFKL